MHWVHIFLVHPASSVLLLVDSSMLVLWFFEDNKEYQSRNT